MRVSLKAAQADLGQSSRRGVEMDRAGWQVGGLIASQANRSNRLEKDFVREKEDGHNLKQDRFWSD